MNLSFNNLSKGYEGKMIFENIGGQISDGDKIGLIGANGVGKTTLVNILTGKEESDTGEIRCSPYIKPVYRTISQIRKGYNRIPGYYRLPIQVKGLPG